LLDFDVFGVLDEADGAEQDGEGDGGAAKRCTMYRAPTRGRKGRICLLVKESRP